MDIIANILCTYTLGRSQLGWQKKIKTTTIDFFWQLVLLLFSFFFFFFFVLKISQTLSPSFSWWKSMSWIHDRKKILKNNKKENILDIKYKNWVFFLISAHLQGKKIQSEGKFKMIFLSLYIDISYVVVFKLYKSLNSQNSNYLR